MDSHDLSFVIPTYRLRDVSETVEQYDQHFWKNGHTLKLIVFDDSSPANQQKYFELLERTRTHNDLFYVGPHEKEQFLAYLNGRLHDARLEGLVKNLFRPSYGGNRNCALMYTLGGLLVSSDDDMRPYALMEDSPESLETDEISRGRLHKAGSGHYVRKSFDIIGAFKDVLGKTVAEIPDNYERGELLTDSAMDLETNATKGVALENSLVLQRGAVDVAAVVKIAQTFRSGTNDIDAIDFVDLFARVLKHADTFGVFDQHGDIGPGGLGEEGLYHEGTRFLSRLTIALEGVRPFYLDSAIAPDNELLTITLTNPDLVTGEGRRLPLATLHLGIKKFLWNGVLYQQVLITNHGHDRAAIALTSHFAADYADIFDVRGTRRLVRGRDLEPEVRPDRVTLMYQGRDGIRRSTHLHFDPPPSELSASAARYPLELDPHQQVKLLWDVACESAPSAPHRLAFHTARAEVASDLTRRKAVECRIETSDGRMNAWIDRARADLRTLTTDLPTGPYPYAGVPWFNTPFGRDGLIAAWQSLWLQPALARGVLAFLARTQATEIIPERDAEPGKILHETRAGELAALGEIPFGRYYGSVDSTPLFVALAGAYVERTADLGFVRSIWSSIVAALDWIDRDGDRDGDGFIEYERHTPAGLLHQGWKDGDDAVMHQDGSMATGPIALCEVQGYVHAAWRAAAALARAMDDSGRAEIWEGRAAQLRQRFEEAFWCEEIGTFALALDGRKAPCRVRTSNAGQCLFGGIIDPDRAQTVARTLMGPDGFSGWGIRTLAAGEARYNPMGYHTGGVWPHDNALIAEGLAQYGFPDEASLIMQAQFEAGLHFDLQRMPELFCGFEQQPGEAPVPYPLACAPQAWAAGAVLLLLKACLGVQIEASRRRVTFRNPRVPRWLDHLSIFDLDVDGARVDLSINRHGDAVSVSVLRNDDSVDIVLR